MTAKKPVAKKSAARKPATKKSATGKPPLLLAENLKVRFAVGRAGWRKKRYLTAVDDISFEIPEGKTLAIVGESGSGKTTAALAVARLVESHDSKVMLDGEDVMALEGEALRAMRRKVQIIFQDPYSSLNPRQRAEDIVREPLDSLTTQSATEKQKIVDDLFEAVGLRPEQKRLFPHQFSGGQRQRIGIARALSTRPKLIICDEPVSALDVAVQAQILNLLGELQKKFGLTYLFISHDLGVVQHMCDFVAVMYMGRIVEYAPRLELFNNPKHPYTRALLQSVPSIEAAFGKNRIGARDVLAGDPPDPTALPPGCRFATRCPMVADTCRATEPGLETKTGKAAHRVACHFAE